MKDLWIGLRVDYYLFGGFDVNRYSVYDSSRRPVI